MKELDQKQAPAISGGYADDDAVIPVNVPIEEFPTNPVIGPGDGGDLPFEKHVR